MLFSIPSFTIGMLYKFPASLLAIAAECASLISLIIFTLPAVSYVGTVFSFLDLMKSLHCPNACGCE